MRKIVKRDGRVEDFNREKVIAAVGKAVIDANGSSNPLTEEEVKLCETIADRIEGKKEETLSVESVQDIVELELMKSKRKDVAKQYIMYREKRNIARKAKTRAVFTDIINIKSNDITRENANMNADTPAGMMMKFASETSKSFVDDCLLSRDVKDCVTGNYIHIHDKDYLPSKSLTCVQSPLNYVLENGFSTGHAEIRPAKRIETAATLACISMETTQNEMHGGQAIPAFDYYLAPYVRMAFKEELKKIGELAGTDYSYLGDIEIEDYTERDLDGLKDSERAIQFAINRTVDRVHQSMEGFIHNMVSIHSRGGNQTVFSSINYGTDTSAEGRCIIRELLKSTYRGVGNGSTAIFPIQIWKKKRGVSYLPTDRNYDLYKMACKVCARRFFPNFVNLDTTYNKDDEWREDDPKRYEHEVATMGCRTRVFENRFGPKTSIGRGNLSFTTVNIVRLAIECMEIENKDERIEKFFEKLNYVLEITARQLDERFNFQKTAYAKQFPLLMKGLWLGSEKLKPMDTVESVINQGTLGIGFIGLAECLKALVGKHHGESDEAQSLGLRIVHHMWDKANEFSERYKHNYSVLATPAEGLSGKFTKKDQADFGKIEGITDREYYTNSNHVPVYYKCTALHKAEIEGPYHEMTRGGHIFYVEVDGDATHNPDAVMKIVDMMDKYNIGYGSINHNRNRCMDCGYENADKEMTVCPKCGGTHIDKLQRITGYLVGTTDRWNHAKLAELNDRVRHDM